MIAYLNRFLRVRSSTLPQKAYLPNNRGCFCWMRFLRLSNGEHGSSRQSIEVKIVFLSPIPLPASCAGTGANRARGDGRSFVLKDSLLLNSSTSLLSPTSLHKTRYDASQT